VPAAIIGKQLYLFDAELGLPIPGPDGKGIATLEEAVGSEAVLKQLDLPGGAAYPQSPATLTNVVALIEAEPEALARRMLLLQKELPSKQHLILSVDPSGLKTRLLRDCPQVKSVRLWHVPLEAILYQYGRPAAFAKDPQAGQKFFREEIVFYMPGRPLTLGRNFHLQGQFEDREQVSGARTLYLASRTPDQERSLVYTSDKFRQAIGITQGLPENEEQKKAYLESIVVHMQRLKEHATYWLGLTYYESGKYAAAIEWLDERVLQTPLPSPWMASARYNLARSYEALRQTEKAIALLEADDSPQQHGNKLRALWLKQK
jgi:tetratricopeptide (TPR) repeat protein